MRRRRALKSRFPSRPVHLKQETLAAVLVPTRCTSVPASCVSEREEVCQLRQPAEGGWGEFRLGNRQGFRCTTNAERGRWLADYCKRKSECWGAASRALDGLDSQPNGGGLKASAWLERPPRCPPFVSWFCLGWDRRFPAAENSDQRCQRECCCCWSKPPTRHSARVPDKLKSLGARGLSALS